MINSTYGQNCTSLYSYGAYFETVSFLNQSSVSNAHYWWNFGDGTSSHFENPVHTFPETGKYLVTLFAKDTISECSDYYELWLNVTKFSMDSCQTSITDSVFTEDETDRLLIIDNSTNCESYNSNYDGGPGHNYQLGNTIYLSGGWHSGRFLSRVQYYTYDDDFEFVLKREAYKSTLYNYSSDKNYGDCSANFEFSVIAEDTGGQHIFFEAMNKNALSYEWEITGFGNPIYSYEDTTSQWYNFVPLGSIDTHLVGLRIEGPEGCQDTLFQQLLIRPGITTVLTNENILLSDIEYQIYPNPFSVQTKLKFDNPDNSTHQLILSTMTGEIVRTIDNIHSSEVQIERSNLPSGIYFFQLYSKSRRIASGKIIIQ
jgi:PKD repeat protein